MPCESISEDLLSIWDLPALGKRLQGDLGDMEGRPYPWEFLTCSERSLSTRNNHLTCVVYCMVAATLAAGTQSGCWGLSWRCVCMCTSGVHWKTAAGKNVISDNKWQGDQKWCFRKKKKPWGCRILYCAGMEGAAVIYQTEESWFMLASLVPLSCLLGC